MDSYTLLFVGLLTFRVLPLSTTTLAAAAPAAPATYAPRAFDSGAQHVRLRNSGFCVDVPTGSDASGPVALQLWDCVEGNINQAWLHTSSSRAPGNPVVISSDTHKGRCIGVTGGTFTHSLLSMGKDRDADRTEAAEGGVVQLVACEEKLTVWANSPFSLCLWENRGEYHACVK